MHEQADKKKRFMAHSKNKGAGLGNLVLQKLNASKKPKPEMKASIRELFHGKS